MLRRRDRCWQHSSGVAASNVPRRAWPHSSTRYSARGRLQSPPRAVGPGREMDSGVSKRFGKPQEPDEARPVVQEAEPSEGGRSRAMATKGGGSCHRRGWPCSIEISAASVLAKVSRDRQMDRLDALHPLYGFKAHKGYGTEAHLKAIRQHGICSEHRKTFGPIREAIEREKVTVSGEAVSDNKRSLTADALQGSRKSRKATA
mmetsp:Transcript_24541/g.51283  ORF Transcript_24541/g.51283 Transcript_24541/m.51283 type:complete len:203 (-) Transcript_24541:83-691(-)